MKAERRFWITAVVPWALTLLLADLAGAATPAVRVPLGFHAAKGAVPEPYTKTGWASEIVHNKTGMELVFIPAGEFLMGSAENEEGRDNDEIPKHRVRITKPFYLGKYEVTQSQWKAAMGGNPSYFKGEVLFPVERVSWNDSQDFLKKAGDGLCLPTEAQWEYACRAGSKTKYFFSDDPKDLDKYAWFEANYKRLSHKVGAKKPNAWGLYDIYGNVWEWCQDWYDPIYYTKSPTDDPKGPDRGVTRVIRGGGLDDYASSVRSAHRRGIGPVVADFNIVGGLRAALPLP